MIQPTDADTAREMAEVPWEPLLPIEKQLIATSLGLGVVLLAVLYWASQRWL